MTEKRFVPATELTFATVSEDKLRLSAFLASLKKQVWVFDLERVTTCDSAGLALLIHAKRMSQHVKCPCVFTGISPAVRALIQFCGVDMFILEKEGG